MRKVAGGGGGDSQRGKEKKKDWAILRGKQEKIP